VSVKTVPAGAVNGMPGFTDYAYGASRSQLRPVVGRERPDRTRRGQPRLPERIVTALRAAGGEASTTRLAAVVELDGGPAFTPAYFYQVLKRLSAQEPAVITQAGRERDGRGRPGRWRLAPAAGRLR
jgi:hypothetical protein